MNTLNNLPNHIGIIMDGNGRWAKKRGLPRNIGHYYGGKNLGYIANLCNKLNIKYLTVFAFSTENWKRPKDEVSYLMSESVRQVRLNYDKIINAGIKINFIGRRDRIPQDLLFLIEDLETNTKLNKGLNLIIALDYGFKDDLKTAIKKILINKINPNDINDNTIKDYLSTSNYPDIDLLIRTSGELRISNFLLFEIAYSELYFTKKYWPSFKKKDLLKALKNYQKRNRRYGGLK